MQIESAFPILAISQATAPQSSQPASSNAQVRNAVDDLNAGELLGFDRQLRFSTDPQSRLGIVQVLSRSSGEVITQIPSELILGLAQALKTNH